MTLHLPTRYRREGIRNRNANPGFTPKCLRCLRVIGAEVLILHPKSQRCRECREDHTKHNKGRKR